MISSEKKLNSQIAALFICLATPLLASAQEGITGPLIVEDLRTESGFYGLETITDNIYAKLLVNPHATNPNDVHRWSNEADLMAQANLEQVIFPAENESGPITRKVDPTQCLDNVLPGGLVMWLTDEGNCTVWKNEGKGVVTSVSSRGKKSWLTYEPFRALPPGNLMTQTGPYNIVIRTDLMKPVTP